MTPTTKRSEILDFPAVYAFDKALFAVHKDSSLKTKADLNGKRIGVTISSSWELYLKKRLSIDAVGTPPFSFDVTPGKIASYDQSTFALDDLRLGDGVRLDAILSTGQTLKQAIKKGYPIRIIDEFVFAEPLAVAIDKNDPEFNDRLAKIISSMKTDGTLKKLSLKWYGIDRTSAN